ncbi:sigma-54 interaction domain-containing protein [Alkalihalobacterium elongatum]|uniref:sigma-54 interaction domain-containing protein n=1 Tax=Alkalihalobacterium elongatum TaxID=2675466 RepID=UPI001C1F7F1A|nr:sigma 54-interacting transcriptional regulator [Alkalihalobacterium elongatum]
MKLEHHLLSILESLHDAVIVVLTDYTVSYVNKAYTEQFNVPKDKIIGKNLHKIEESSRIIEVIKSGKPLINDCSYVHSLKKDVCANITPLMENGEMIGVVTIMKDISEVTHLEEELKKYKTYSTELRKQLDRRNFSLLNSSVYKMKTSVSLAKKVAATDVTIMLYGESGVGKEVFAKAIHEASTRHDQPFIPINIASIPDNLFESELFGFEEGSFTGSRKGGKKGLIELARGGTLFLDEIGEMSLNVQAKLLRVIQERSFHKVGGTKAIPMDVRIICATNRNLSEEIKKGTFREDLYYRINVVPITIPPLRDRKEDLPFLVENLLHQLKSKYGKHVSVDEDIIVALKQYDWPGNVRELYNVLEHMVAVCPRSHFVIDDIPDYIREGTDNKRSEPPLFQRERVELRTTNYQLHEALENTEKTVLQQVIKVSKNRSDAINKLGISRKAFYAKLKKYDMM